MLLLTKTVHVLALGLWFGTTVFFTFVVGLSLFTSFEALSAKPAGERPMWFPVPAEFEKEPPSDRFPNPVRKEQGSRAAGYAVGPMFVWYYGTQVACGLLALATSLAWLSPGGTIPKARAALLGLALAGAVGGWLLEHKVDELRVPRNDATDAVLRSAQPTPETIQKAGEARADFGRWHGYSLLVNLVTLLLVTVAMALAAQLPTAVAASPRHEPQARAAVPLG